MRALLALTIANAKSYLRDRAALFWTLAFPLIFIFLFGFIFQGGGSASLKIGWVDLDKSAESTQLRVAFATPSTNELSDLAQQDALDQMQSGKLDTVIVVPAGYGAALGPASAGSGGPTSLIVYTDPSRQSLSASVYQTVGAVLGVVNLGGRP